MPTDPVFRVGSNLQTEPTWTSGTQPVTHPFSQQVIGAAKFGLGVGAIALAGRYQFPTGKTGFDYLLHGVRAVEEYSPGRVFRTFQVSHMMSSLETPSRQRRYFSRRMLSRMVATEGPGRVWLDHLNRLTGRDFYSGEIIKQGFRFENGKLLLGETGDEVLLKHAGVLRAPTGAGTRFQEAYARSLAGGGLVPRGVDTPKGMGKLAFEARFGSQVFGQNVQYIDEAGKLALEPFMFTGGQSRVQAAGRFLGGYGTSLVERINQLARAPFELPVISDIMNRIPIINKMQMGVVPSSGLKTLGKITAKLGILGTGAYLAYQELDHLARTSEILDNTILAQGITAGVATGYTRAQVTTAKTLELLGLQKYQQAQEAMAPGSTELSKLAAFPIMGALGGLGIGYGARILNQVGYRKLGLGLGEASQATLMGDELLKARLYDKPIPEHITSAVDPKTLSLIQGQTEKRLNSWQGKLAKRVATKQQGTGIVSSLLKRMGPATPGRMLWTIGAALGASLIAPLVPGALIPSKSAEELEALYSGQERVAIRKGRWWEFGRSAYEGQRIERFQEHWYPRMLSRAKEKSIWGEDEPSPLEKWWIENFTYELEQKHYKERPYPITGAGLEEVPFIGPILSATIGRIFKPPALMHQEEWMREGGGGIETANMPAKFGETVVPGELERGSPISPYGIKGVVGEQVYRMTEMVGLPGFTMTAIKDAITGRADVFDQEMQLESATRMYGWERSWWDQELGGLLGTNELLRRLYPHRRRQIEQYNPIKNLMPDWMPGPGQRAPDFLHGDPYVKVQMGEERLPGAGYAALHPEVAGVDPADYPLIHKFSILADVAPYSDKYKDHLIKVRSAIKKGQLTSDEIELYKRATKEVAAKKVKKDFTPYKYRDRAMTPMEEILAAHNEVQKEDSGPSWFEQTVGSYWETLAHSSETPLEYLTPVSPASKLVHMRTAVEDYETTQVWGTQNAFWGHPIRDFFKPFFDASYRALGGEGIPSQVQERRDLEEYFDILKYVKHTRLKREANLEGDKREAAEHEERRRETLFGINPYTFNFSHIFRSLPRRDRDYFNDFVKADMEERKEILEVIPENERDLMLARWKLKDAADMKQAIKKGLLSEEQVEQAEASIERLYEAKEDEGMPKDKELWVEYLETRLPGESYADWYRRVKLLEKDLEGRPLPGPDWVGWSPQIDLEDIKAKIVLDEGKNTYDYDLWPDRLRAVARRPILEEATEALEEKIDPDELKIRIRDVLSANGIRATSINLMPVGTDTNIDLNIEQDRLESDKEKIRRMLKDDV